MVVQLNRDPNRFARNLFAPLPARYERLAALLSMGQNGRWRSTMIDHVEPERQQLILDVACGPAGVSIELADRSVAQIVGIDLTLEMLEQGANAISVRGMSERIRLVNGRAEQLPFADATFDALTFTYLLRYVDDPTATLAELARVVKPGGPVASMEFLLPPTRFWRSWWWGYTRLVLPVAGLLTGGRQWYEVGRFLGPNISGHYRKYPVDWTVKAWEQAGLVDVGFRPMSLGGGLVMWGRRSSD